MTELTVFFTTTDRALAHEALESLRAQEPPCAVVIIRNVRPLHAAYSRTLECRTPYCMLLDDDVILEPGVVSKLLERFREMRADRPKAFMMTARVYCEARERWGKGGLKFYYTPLLKEVGWPDTPHVAAGQKKEAARLGLEALGCDIEAGVQKRGSDLDVYKKYLWIQVRAEAGQLKSVSMKKLVRRARRGGEPWLWFAALGLLDGKKLGGVATSKDEKFVGPIAKDLDFDTLGVEDVRRALADNGVEEAASDAGGGLLSRLGLRS
jgi:hypothetical protein